MNAICERASNSGFSAWTLIGIAAIVAAIQAIPSFAAAAQLPAMETAANREADGLIAQSQARLAFALLEKVAGNGSQTTISPASVAAAFGVVSLGADPAMKAAIAGALGFDPDRAEAGLAALKDVCGKLANAGDAFRSVNRIVFAPSNPPNGNLRAALDSLDVDYAIADLSDPEASAKVDAWVGEVTKGAIPEILGGPIDRATFVALNALRFKSRWKTPFDQRLTAPAAFTGIDGKSADVAMMRLGRGRRAFRQERHREHSFVAVDLPFADERFSLIVATTTGEPATAREFAPVAPWLAGIGFTVRSGDLALPRFSASGRQDLMPALDSLGLDKARRSDSALQGIAPGAMLSRVVQRTMIDVDEEGAEAAAATAAIGTRMLEADDGVHMIVDKPFVYALRDKATGLILVAGYVGQPPKTKTG
jgi:serine protease inhibitor